MTEYAGQTLSLLLPGCSPSTQLGGRRDNPDEETTDWRAVCGKTARTVRREGRRKPSLPLSSFDRRSFVQLKRLAAVEAWIASSLRSSQGRFRLKAERPNETSRRGAIGVLPSFAR